MEVFSYQLKNKLKVSVFQFNSSMAAVQPEGVKPTEILWICVCGRGQLTGNACWTRDLCECCCAQCCTISRVLLSVFWVSSSVFSHVACWCFCQYRVWPPGGAAATVCMTRAEASGPESCLWLRQADRQLFLASTLWWFQLYSCNINRGGAHYCLCWS